ncbi:ergosterol biosynthesis protein [Trapelia coarctata]|nr:ergosterol biosynthesis protein [Trapelia coarctata]
MNQYFPQHDGLLPFWLLLTSAASVGNTIQAFSTLKYTRRVYSGSYTPSTPAGSKPLPATSPVSPLQARTFGVWSLLSSVIRLYAAYYIDNPLIYQLTLCTYVIAWGHFMSEWLYFGTAAMGAGLASPLVVANGSLIWMLMQWGFYVQ